MTSHPRQAHGGGTEKLCWVLGFPNPCKVTLISSSNTHRVSWNFSTKNCRVFWVSSSLFKLYYSFEGHIIKTTLYTSWNECCCFFGLSLYLIDHVGNFCYSIFRLFACQVSLPYCGKIGSADMSRDRSCTKIFNFSLNWKLIFAHNHNLGTTLPTLINWCHVYYFSSKMVPHNLLSLRKSAQLSQSEASLNRLLNQHITIPGKSF